jgi:hypothetical protein
MLYGRVGIAGGHAEPVCIQILMIRATHDVPVAHGFIPRIAAEGNPLEHFDLACGFELAVFRCIQRLADRHAYHARRVGHVELTLWLVCAKQRRIVHLEI